MAKIILNVELRSEQASQEITNLQKSVDLIANTLKSVQPNKDLTAQLNALAKAFNALAREAAQVEKSDRERAALTAKLAKLEAETATAEAKRAKATSEVAVAAEKAAKATEQTREATAKADTAEQKLAAQTAKTAAEIEKLSGTQEEATISSNKLGDSFERFIDRLAKGLMSSALNSFRRNLIGTLEDVGETLVKTENAVIELNRVLDDPQPAQEVSNRLYDLAYQYGSTFENASTIAANFARAGRSWNESIQATEAALLAMNVAELNATEASDGLLSIIAQFDMEASDLIDVVDKLNKTADKNPVSTQKLLQAIQRAGSAAKNANVSFDQTLGLITSISEATNRSGQNIGTAINSLIQYSTKNVDVFSSLSKEAEDIVDKFKVGMASIVDVWNQVAIDIHNNKEARDNIISALGTDGLEELSSTLHDELGDLVTQINDTYDVANTYRKNYFIALLDNMDRYFTVQQQLTDYQGYSQEENAKYMETYTAKVNQLNDAWQKLANDEQGILGLKKSLVEMGISLVEMIDNGGGLVAILGEISALVISVITFVSAKKISDWLVDIGGQFKIMVQTIRNLTTGTREAMTAAQGLQAAFGWVSIAVAAVTVLIGIINAYNAQQEEARNKAIALGKETTENAKQIAELRKELLKLNPNSAEYRDIEQQIVELLGDKKIELEGLISVTEKYRDKVLELTDAEIKEAQYSVIRAKEAAITNANKDFNWSANITGLSYEDKDLSILATSAKTIEDKYQVYLKISERLKELEKEYVIAVANGDKAQQNSLDTRIKYLEKFVNNTAESMEEYRIAVENETTLARIALDQSIEGLTESLVKVPAAARKSQAELQAIAEEAGISLDEVKEAFDQVGTHVSETIEEIPDDVQNALEMTDAELEKHLEKVSGTVSIYSEAADAIDLVTKAQAEYADQGQLSLDTVEKLAKLGADWVAVLFDENGAVDVNSESVNYLIGQYEALLEQSGYLIEKTSKETEQMKDLSAEIDSVQSALSVLKSAQDEYNETGSLSIDTIQTLLELDHEYIGLLSTEEGQLRINEEAVDDLVKAKKDLVEELIAQRIEAYANDRLNYYLSQSTENAGDVAEVAAEQFGKLALAQALVSGNAEEAAKAEDALFETLARKVMKTTGKIQLWTEDYANDVIAFAKEEYKILDYLDTSRSGWERSSGASKSSSSSSKSSSGSSKDEELERRKAIVSLRESELTLMEHQGASQEDQIAKIREIQAGIHDVAEHLRATNASQEDINKQMSEWWKWEEKINKFAEDNAKAAEKAAADQKKAAEEAEKAAKKAAEDALKAEEERIKAETARKKQDVTNAKAALTLMEKQGKSISDRVAKMKEIQDLLHVEAEWLREIKAEQAEIDALSAEWWDWQEKILKLYQDILAEQKQIKLDAIQKTIDAIIKEIDLEEEALDLEQKRLAVDEARADLEEEIAEAKINYVKTVLSDYLTALSDAETLEEKQRAVAEAREKLVQAQREAQAKSIIDAFKAEREVKSDTLSLEEKRLAVEKARQALADAENDRTVRVYNEASGQWEYQANAKEVQSAKDSLKSAVDALNAYVEEQAWNEVAEAVENGSVSEAEVLQILERWAREAYGNDSPEFVARIQTAFRKAMGTAANPDSVSGQISAVDNAVKSLNDYLKQEAVKELKSYIAAGNTDTAGMRSILNKWLSLGEGGELYSWRDGLLATVTDAVRSGYYDDSAVQSQVQAVENAVESLHDYLRNRFIREIEDIVKNGTADQIVEAIERWSKEFGISDKDRDWAERLAGAKREYENTEKSWDEIMTNGQNASAEQKRAVVKQMQANSDAWWEAGSQAEKDRLAAMNLALGSMMGWTRDEKSGIWYDEEGRRLYDKGGVLTGKGGIKATNRPEIILDPELTAQILKPGSETQFRAFADALHLMFEHGDRHASSAPVYRSASSVDSHNTSYTVNGIPIGTNMAEQYTIAELFRVMPLVGAN